MAAPKNAPQPVIDESRSYASPAHVPDSWKPVRPGDLERFQPQGAQLGYQGPDQGYGLKLANGFRPRLQLQPGEDADDAVAGCLGIGLRRASMYSRAPVVHDFTIAFTIWGFLDASAPADLVEERRARFVGVSHGHHYTEARDLVDMVPVTTLQMSPHDVQAAFPQQWRELVGH